MYKTDPTAIATWDTADNAVMLSHVTKIFTQRQRTGTGKDILKNLLHPKSKTVVALQDVSFNIKKGAFVAYAGPNGAGKSTTIKLLCGMLAPQQGQVQVLGMQPGCQRIPLMRRCGILFGNRTELWWDHPVEASFAWKKVVWDIPEERYRRMRERVVEQLGLAGLMQTFARELSLGQRMRADLGLMLLHEPELILLDEPTLGLDVLAKRQMIRFLKQLNRECGTTIIVTSHDMDDLEEMAQRILLISKGSLAFDGDFADLRKSIGVKRRLVVTTSSAHAPVLPGLEHRQSRDGQHTYSFDAGQISITAILGLLSDVQGVTDVEIGKDSLEEMLANLFEGWTRKNAPQ